MKTWFLFLVTFTTHGISQINYPVTTIETNLLIAPFDAIVINTAYYYGDIRRYGAQPNTLSEKAIDFACLAMAQMGQDVLIPIGTFLVGAPDAAQGLDGQIQLTSSHNGLTIRGFGFDSVLKRADAVVQNLAVIYIGTSINQVKDITLENFRIDGNRANQNISNPPSQRNIWVDGFNNDLMISAKKPPTNIVLKNINSHSSALNGAYISAASSQVTDYTGWDNGKHGLAIGAPNDVLGPGHQAVLETIHCYDNVWYGINISARDLLPQNLTDLNTVTVRNFLLENNGLGMKFAAYTIAHVSKGRITGSADIAINTTKAVRDVTIEDVETQNNGGAGIKIQEPGNYTIHNFRSLDDDIGLYFAYSGNDVTSILAKGITVRSPQDRAMLISGNMKVTIEDYQVDGDGISSLYVVQTNVDDILMRNGSIRAPEGKYGLRVEKNANFINLRLNPSPGSTTHGIHLAQPVQQQWLVLTDVDVSRVTGTVLLNPNDTVDVVKTRVTGLP